MSRDSVTSEMYDVEEARMFIEWAEDMGFVPYHYRGRFFWEGPAVDLSHVGAVIRCPVEWQHDQMGLGVVVYPRQSAKLREVHDGEERP